MKYVVHRLGSDSSLPMLSAHIISDRVSQKNSAIGAVVRELEDILLESYDGWKHPTAGLVSGYQSKKGAELRTALRNAAQKSCYAARMVAAVNLVDDLALYLRGLPYRDPANQPGYIEERLSFVRAQIAKWREGKYCLPSGTLTMCGTDKATVVSLDIATPDSTAREVLCRGPVSDSRIVDRCNRIISNHQEKAFGQVIWQDNSHLRTVIYSLLVQLSDFKQIIVSMRQNAFTELEKVDTLYEEQIDLGVQPETIVRLNRDFLDQAETNIVEQNDPPPEYEEAFPKYTAALALVGGLAVGIFGAQYLGGR